MNRLRTITFTETEMAEIITDIIAKANYSRSISEMTLPASTRHRHTGKADAYDDVVKDIRNRIAEKAPRPALRLVGGARP